MEGTIGVQMDSNGRLHSLPEDAFVTAMISGRMIDALSQKNVSRRRTRTVLIKKKSLVNPLGAAVQETRATLNTEDRLVAWTVRRQHAAAAFSGTVQLLLLTHTPVSRKVFQWFHCHDIAGRVFSRADVSCGSVEGSSCLFCSVFYFLQVLLVPFLIHKQTQSRSTAVPHRLPERRLARLFPRRLPRFDRVHCRAPALHRRVLVRAPGRAFFDRSLPTCRVFIFALQQICAVVGHPRCRAQNAADGHAHL